MNSRGRVFTLAVILLVLAAGVFYLKFGSRKISFREKGAAIKPLGENEISPGALSLQDAFVKVASRIRPAVVNISSIQTIQYPAQEYYFGDPFEQFFEDYFGAPQDNRRQRKPRSYRQEGGGSGVIISEDGYILTNEHVIHNADEIKVRVNISGEDKTYQGKVAGKDSRTDLAIIKIDGKGLPSAPLGDSDKVNVGEWVIAIGSPFGLEQTVTSGIISAVRQSLSIEGRQYRDFIQTDAAINRGNSGGPLCNIRGEIIGINTAIYAPTGVFAGIGFAIPINRAKEVLDDLMHKGKVVRGWLGVEIKPVDEAIKKQFGLPDKDGALVNSVIEGTPADRYGLQRGDVIREYDGKKIKSPGELQSVVSKTDPNKKVRIKVIRGGRETSLELVTAEMPSDDDLAGSRTKKEEPLAWLDMKLSDKSAELDGRYGIPASETGVVVAEIASGGRAQEIGLAEGDLIKSINRRPTPDINAVEKLKRGVNLSEGVVFDIIRAGKPMFISYVSP